MSADVTGSAVCREMAASAESFDAHGDLLAGILERLQDSFPGATTTSDAGAADASRSVQTEAHASRDRSRSPTPLQQWPTRRPSIAIDNNNTPGVVSNRRTSGSGAEPAGVSAHRTGVSRNSFVGDNVVPAVPWAGGIAQRIAVSGVDGGDPTSTQVMVTRRSGVVGAEVGGHMPPSPPHRVVPVAEVSAATPAQVDNAARAGVVAAEGRSLCGIKQRIVTFLFKQASEQVRSPICGALLVVDAVCLSTDPLPLYVTCVGACHEYVPRVQVCVRAVVLADVSV